MKPRHILTKVLYARVTDDTYKKFLKKVVPFGNSSHVLREFIEAFNDDRLIVKAPAPTKESLYVD